MLAVLKISCKVRECNLTLSAGADIPLLCKARDISATPKQGEVKQGEVDGKKHKTFPNFVSHFQPYHR